MSDTPNVLVRYERNADNGAATGAIHFDDDREDLLVGGVGYVTEEEVHRLTGFGVQLKPIEEEEARELGLLVDAPKPSVDEPVALSLDLSPEDIKAIAEAEGVDLTGLRSKEKQLEAIQEKRSEQEVGPASLPATAGAQTSTPSTPATASGSSSGSAS